MESIPRDGKSDSGSTERPGSDDHTRLSAGDSPNETPIGASGGESLGFFVCPAMDQHGWFPLSEIRLPMSDLGFRKGVIAVERLRTYDGHLFQKDRHLTRFENTLEAIGLSHVVTIETMAALASEVLERNRGTVPADNGVIPENGLGNPSHDVGMTWWVTPDSYALHCNRIDHVAVERRRWDGQPLVLTQVQQPSSRSWSRQAKVRSRLHYHLADQQAESILDGAIGLLHDEDGSWTESSVANFALVCEDQILFPPDEQILHGVTQSVVREIADELGIAFSERRIHEVDIQIASEVLLMGTDTGLWFANTVCSHTGQIINQLVRPRPHSIIRQIQNRLPQGKASASSSASLVSQPRPS